MRHIDFIQIPNSIHVGSDALIDLSKLGSTQMEQHVRILILVEELMADMIGVQYSGGT